MYSYIRRHFVGPRIREDILDFVRSCPECQTTKPRHDKPYGIIIPIEPPQEPWSDISMDLITGLTKSNNCTAILVVVDRFSQNWRILYQLIRILMLLSSLKFL